MRFYMDDRYSKKDVSAVGLKFVFISIALFALALLINYYFDILKPIKDYSVLVFIYYISNLVNQYLTQMSKGKEQVRNIAVAGVINTAVTLILNLLLLLVFNWGLQGFYISYIVGQISSALILFIRSQYWKDISFVINKQYEKEMLTYSVPLVLGTIGWWCNNASDRYLVTYLCGIASNGIYSVAYKIPSILTTFQQIFLQAWQISAVKEFNDQDSPVFYGKIFETINLTLCIICMGLIFFTQPIAKLLYANDFYSAWKYVPFLLVSGVFNGASGIIGPILNANKNSKSLGTSSLIGAVVNVLLNYGLIKFIGVQGAAVATAISSYTIYLFRKIAVGERILIKKYYKVYFSWILIIGQAAVSISVGKPLFELFFIVIFLCVYFNELRKMIFDVINKIKVFH